MINQYVDNQWISGATGIIARHGKIVYHRSFGMRDIEKDDPMQNDNIYRIASMSKAITTVAAMMLYEEGYFLLDDAERLVTLYEPDGEGGLRPSRDRDYYYPIEGGKSYYSGGAGLLSTAEDYCKFLQMLLNNGQYGEHQLLSRKTIEIITKNQVGAYQSISD